MPWKVSASINMDFLFLITKYIFNVTCIFSIVTLIWFIVESHIEKENRAVKMAFLLLLLLIIVISLAFFVSFPWKEWFYVAWSFVFTVTVVLFSLPINGEITKVEMPSDRIDERDIMFSRRRLIKDVDRFNDYYSRRPEKLGPDNLFREKPGLLNSKSQLFDRFQFGAAESSFKTVESLYRMVSGTPSKEKVQVSAENITGFLKSWIKKFNVVSVGVAEMQDYHWYSHIGRGGDYGEEVKIEHKFGIAFAVEMDREQMSHAPYGPTVMESASRYLSTGTIAVQVAEFIRGLGYGARAHIDENYRVVCPLVARDAGLGELGRMGLLMTPELGPRVRIAVVTTNIPLITDKTKDFPEVIDFCRICKKCADVCPSNSISYSDKEEIDGINRWQINSESCFTYWCTVGTDCGRCVYVCPYSHPGTTLHNIVRKGISRNKYFRKFALEADNFFYGKNPPVVPVPDCKRFIS